MSEFKKNIEEYHDVSLDNIKCAAVNALPAQYRHKPWCITNKGGSDVDNTIYTEELQLNAYLASYTDWHKGKLEKAFALLNEPLPRQINIIDWACGQGMATLFILDYIKQNVLPCSIKEVILIEPSKVALERAVYLITKAAPGIFIKSVNKKINDVTANDLAFNHQSPIYQMFSNILDIGGIDHKHLTQILYTNKLYSNTLVCVSPYYLSGNFRINSFFKYFQRPLALEKHELLSDKNQLGYTYTIDEAFGALRFDDNLYLINLIDGEIRAKKLMTVHKKMDEADIELFSLGDESDGTKRLFDYIPLILDLIQGGKVFIVDEMERSLHPSLIKQIILLFYKHSKDVSSQLIFTTHESSLMDQKIFRRDEIWLMKKDNNGISSFGRMDNLYNVRFDKMLQNSYLNGEYGATPIFETEEEINKLFSSLK